LVSEDEKDDVVRSAVGPGKDGRACAKAEQLMVLRG
jgi:hypothetical protein